MPCPCCNPQPCSVVIDGVPVALSTFDTEAFLDISWNGAAVPGGTDTLVRDGVVESVNPTGWFWNLSTIDTGFTSNFEYSAKWLQGGVVRWQFPIPDGHNAAVLFGAEIMSATECLLFGYCNTYEDFVPGRNFDEPFNCTDRFAYNSLWRWEAMLTNGVLGVVTVTAVKGYKNTYVADQDGNCQNVLLEAASYGPAPTVTLTFAP